MSLASRSTSKGAAVFDVLDDALADGAVVHGVGDVVARRRGARVNPELEIDDDVLRLRRSSGLMPTMPRTSRSRMRMRSLTGTPRRRPAAPRR